MTQKPMISVGEVFEAMKKNKTRCSGEVYKPFTVDLVFKEQPFNELSHLKNNPQGTVNCGDKK